MLPLVRLFWRWRADASQQEQPDPESAGGGAVCCHLTLQTLLQAVRMAHPFNLLQLSWLGIAIFRMQVAKGYGGETF